ncbi:MAG TPA: metalloprotease family protein [Anaerolineae bacterium]|jgi:predicted metal-dependent HD superfamily phosphohydrolase|nr:metalloprotease family protein [Anaerolineae bacterium]
MKSTKDLGAEYVYAGNLDLGERKNALLLNLVGLALLFVFGWLFVQLAAAIRPEISATGFFDVIQNLELLYLVVGLFVVLVVHELLHGLLFWIYTGERPEFGFRVVYAYASAPGWYLPRNQFIVAGLAPIVGLTLVGLVLLPLITQALVAELLALMAFNAAASVGDLVVAGWLLRKPATLMVRDSGPRIRIYTLAEDDVAGMSRRWLKLTGSLGIDEEAARRVFADMVVRYNGDGRYYHILTHVGEVLDTAGGMHDLADDYKSVQLAIWFHDVIYDSRAKDNEVRSAEYARAALKKLGMPERTITRVSDMILKTVTHESENEDRDALILLDADLAPLGADKEVFARQSDALRQEFGWIPEDEYKANRVQALGGFLNRERIYQTDRLYQALEAKARSNLNQAIAELSEAGT